MASIGDVAKLAGVSRSTVSLVCNNKGYVSEEIRERTLMQNSNCRFMI